MKFASSEESRARAYENGYCQDCGTRIKPRGPSSRCPPCDEDSSAYVDSLWGIDQIVNTYQEEKSISRLPTKEPDPYKNVWNSLQAEEEELRRLTRNGCLFVPNNAELARRSIARVRHLLRKARGSFNRSESLMLFEEALIHRDIAKHHTKEHQRELVLSR